jgi:GcrA cell cycle regulator
MAYIPQQPSVWDEHPEIVELLRQLYAQGVSSTEIRDRIGIEFHIYLTRNAVIGKSNRMRLKGLLAPRPGKLTPKAGAKPRVRRIRPPNPPKPPAPVFQQQQQVQPVTWMAEGHRLCQWPHGDPGHPDFGFCGMRAEPDKPYCRQHCDLAYKPESTR